MPVARKTWIIYEQVMTTAILCLVSFLIGTIPFGVLVARARGVDIMNVGSGNIGATNVWRSIGWGPGLIVFLLDVAKGLGPAVYTHSTTGSVATAFFVGLCSVFGHSFSPWIGFRGGKGIATGFGVLIGAMPVVAFSAFGVFLVVLAVSRYVSLASLCASVAMVVFSILFGSPISVSVAVGFFAAFIFYRHRANIGRLMRGEESKFSTRRKDADAPQS